MIADRLVNANGKCSPSCKFKDDVCLNTNEMKTVLTIAKDSKEIKEMQIPKKRSELISEIKKIVSDKCKNNMDDFCLIDKLIKEIPHYEKVKKLEEIKNKRYLTLKPKTWENNPTEWLSNLDIDRVMKQYEIAYKKFKYLGCFPIDFMEKYTNTNQCITNMCHFDITKSDKLEFGMILNLDKHNQPGSHWVAIYINKNTNDSKYGCFYYDSGGTLPSDRVMNFFKLIKNQLNNDKNFNGFYNKTQHQYKNTECGMYAMCFLILCLENKKKTFDEILSKIKPKSDNFINLHRNRLYLSI